MSKVPILVNVEPYERTKLADAFVDEKFKDGDFIIKEGDQGNKFYLIVDGEAFATKTLKDGAEPTVVMNYKASDYFGERALLKNEPRAANIIAKGEETVVVSLDRKTFSRMLGPLEEILKRNMGSYMHYM